MLEEIRKLVFESKIDGVVTKLKHIPEYWNEIEIYTKNFSFESNSEKIYFYINQLTSKPVCKCGKLTSFTRLSTGYREFCSRTCTYAKDAAKDRRIVTMKENGGVGLSNPKAKEKARLTLIEKHGIINPGQLDSVKSRMKESNPMKDPKIVESLKQSNLEKYGIDWASKSEIVKNKIKETNIKKYKRFNPMQSHISDENFKILNDKISFENMFKNNSIDQISTKLDICHTTVLTYLKKHDIRHPREIIPEQQLKDFLLSNGFNDFEKTRKVIQGFELDLYSPTHKLAIEHCGLYWHSRSFVDNNYHRNKYLKCKELGIKLITIFEDEWLNKRSIVESRLLHALGKSETIAGARNHKIIELSTATEFLNQYHIHGSTTSTIKLGAVSKINNQLTAVMTFRKSKDSGAYNTEWEMARFSTNGCNIPGIAGKLLSHFKKSYSSSILSYSDLRWGEGNYLSHLGFIRLEDSAPGYSYFSLNSQNFKRFHRLSYTKKRLLELSNLSSSTLTEYELAKSIQLEQIYDCGNAVWIHK